MLLECYMFSMWPDSMQNTGWMEIRVSARSDVQISLNDSFLDPEKWVCGHHWPNLVWCIMKTKHALIKFHLKSMKWKRSPNFKILIETLIFLIFLPHSVWLDMMHVQLAHWITYSLGTLVPKDLASFCACMNKIRTEFKQNWSSCNC